MLTRSQAIKALLNASTHPDLAALYSSDMEVQVNVAQDDGERISSEGYQGKTWHSYSNGIQQWFSFRIPKKAFSEPENNDFEIKYDISEHAEGIGLTGWDWQNRVSKWVAFDFDAISGHSSKHSSALTDPEIEAVKTIACKIPWVTVRQSTSGNGLHLYVFLDDVPTENHTEHSALGRAILGKMSAITGFDFVSKVDVCGGNMWIWHRKMTLANGGLKLIKQGETLKDIPINWRDHVTVVKGKRHKVLPNFVSEKEESIFEQMTGQRPRVKLDEQHRKFLEFLTENKAQWWYDQDHHMLVCHTYDLKIAHQKLNLRGVFDTVATGKEQGVDHNCFAFPLEHPAGAWVIRRYGEGIQETPNWDQDASGYTRCYFNRDPSLKASAQVHSGMEDEKGAFVFSKAESAEDAAKILGAKLNLPDWIKGRQALLKQHKDGRLVVHIRREPTDKYDDIQGWREDKGWWKKIFNARLQQPGESETINFDKLVRHVVTETGDDYGWVIRTGNKWYREPLTHVRIALRALNFSDSEINKILGNCVLEGWVLVTEPFENEYPGNRKWNCNAAQFRYTPKEDEPYNYPTWQRILDHCGKGLDNSVKHDGWCKTHNILTGADYLKIWVASLFQEPKEPLPYLFLYSKEERTGKTTFHEALGTLMTTGYIQGDVALISQGSFNAELEGAILAVVEETDLRKATIARNRMKDWVTSSYFLIHRKGQTPYRTKNTTHWIQTGNEYTECPIFSGDTRIVMIHVPEFQLEDYIPRKQLFACLEQEASDFMAMILKIEIPPSGDRLNVPVVDTEIKKQTQKLNRSLLEEYLDEMMYDAPGEMILYSEIFTQFQHWLDPSDVHQWTKIRFGRELPPQYPKGRVMSKGAQFHVANLSFTEVTPAIKKQTRLVLRDDRLVPEK